MASGHGSVTKFGRCTNFWQTYYSCTISTPYVDECKTSFEDYFECLHSMKEKKWVRRVEEKLKEKKKEYKNQTTTTTTATKIEKAAH